MAYRRLERRRAVRRETAAGARPPSRLSPGPTPEGGRRQAWTRVVRPQSDAVADRLSPASAGALAGVWAAIASLLGVGLLVMAAWVLGAGNGDFTAALKSAGIGWLATHHLPIEIQGGEFSALPIGISLIPALVLWRAGRWSARRSGACRWPEVRGSVGFGAAVYATVAVFVAGACTITDRGDTEVAGVEPLYGLVGCAVFALLAFGAGASYEAGLWPTLRDRLTDTTRRHLHGTAAAWCVLVCAAAALLGISLVFHFATAVQMTEQLSPGLVGNLLLLLLALCYFPNALTWGIGYLSGAGFAVGEATLVSPFAVTAGPLPAFPLFAAIPGEAAPWAPILLFVPAIAGGIATFVAYRQDPLRLWGIAAWRSRLAIAGLVALSVGLASWLASGSLGAGRLAEVGPAPLSVTVAMFVLVAAGGWLGDAIRFGRRRIQQRRGQSVDVRDAASDVDVDTLT